MMWTHKLAKGDDTVGGTGKGKEAGSGGGGRRISEYNGRHIAVMSPETALHKAKRCDGI